MERYALPLTLLGVALILVAPAGAVTLERDYHETFEVQQGVRLDLKYGDGDVTITPWDRDVIDVRVRYFAEVRKVGFGDEPDFFVDFDQTPDVVRVVGREEIGSGVVFFQSIKEHEYTYTISAPSYVALDLTGDDGDVTISGWRADIECAVDDGDVTVEDVANEATRVSFEDGDVRIGDLSGELTMFGDDGDVELSGCRVTEARISIQDGDVTARDCEGEFTVSVDDGDVDLLGLVSERVEVSGEDGDIKVRLAGADVVDVGVETDDGDITVSLSPGLSYAFAITMDDGDVHIDIPNIDEFTETEHAVAGRARGGGGRVTLSTADGNVVLMEE